MNGKDANTYLYGEAQSRNPHRFGYNKEKADAINSTSRQMPERMYRPHLRNRNTDTITLTPSNIENMKGLPTEEQIDELLLPPAERLRRQQKRKEDKDRSHLAGLELVHRHRYVDDIDILRATFTRTKAEIEQEKFILVQACRKLIQRIHWSLQKVPKHEKYVLGGEIRSSAYSILKFSVAIKKRYYRKNLLEHIDIELDILREYYLIAYTTYNTWVDDAHLNSVLEDINEVGRLVGGLLKSTVV